MLSADLALQLQHEGHDVQRASEVGQARADDELILEHACQDSRTLITLDHHFGDWVILPLSEHPGVIRVKVHPATTDKIVQVLSPFLRVQSQDALRNQLIILSPKNERWVKTAE